MLLAIDVGNTDTKFGVFKDGEFRAVWRRPTHERIGAGALAAWVLNSCAQAGFFATPSHGARRPSQSGQTRASISAVGCASVVPSRDALVDRVSKNLTGEPAFFLRSVEPFGLKVMYDPPNSVGADRLANAIAAVEGFALPAIVVDFGSATTFDVVTRDAFLGGCILPGPKIQAESLSRRTAQLPEVPLKLPRLPIGHSTVSAIQSGILVGHIGAVEGLLRRIQDELGEPATVLATGGLSHMFIGATESINHFLPHLTLDGVAAAFRRDSEHLPSAL